MEQGTWQGLPKLGRAVELGSTQELEVCRRIDSFLEQYNFVTPDFIVREALDLARQQRPGEVNLDAAMKRVMHLGGQEWYKSSKNLNQSH